jgi:glycosyltransferase involved in cell wall biosynthesis
MRYVFVDDSTLAYDGYTPLRRPVGGPEKAVAALATALAERGHEVKVINRVTYAHMADGAYYVPFGDHMIPKAADVLIALRKPLLLGTLRAATHRLLWVMGGPEYLTAEAHAPLWDSFNASLLFLGENQKRGYKGSVRNRTIAPGVRNIYFEKPATPSFGVHQPDPRDETYGYDPADDVALKAAEEAAAQAAANPEPAGYRPPPPHAVVTTHPLQGLGWLIDVWTRLIHPQMPAARLSVYSAVLTKGLSGEEIPITIIPVLEQVKAAAGANVVVVAPLNDEGMADVYRTSRVHLYPGDTQDYACWTLSESQAAGLPAVARSLGGADERLDNGSTGFIVPDAEAFANVTLQILGNDAVHENFSTAAADPVRRRPWALAAQELESFVATLPVDLA